MNTNEIVVGTDGSAAGTAAVRWAARAAARDNGVLRVVYAYDWDWPGARFGGATELRGLASVNAEEIVTDARLAAHAVAPDLPVIRDAIVGSPVPVLLKAAETARLAVVGSRGHGGFASLLLGSVGHRVATHAPCPVVVVRGRAGPGPAGPAGPVLTGPVVVGADGSPAGTDALQHGFEQAAAFGTRLVAVRCHPYPPPVWGLGLSGWAPAALPLAYDPAERDSAEHRELAEQLAPWREKYPDVAVETLVTADDPARVLVAASHTAQLVVVGDRGFGVLAGAVLGSVSSQLAHHADCPVLIARGGDTS